MEEKFGTLPAMAIGYNIPQRRTTEWNAMALLDQALHGGRAGRIYRDLVLEKQIAVEADGGIDDIFGYNGPTQMVTRILHKPEISSEKTLAAFDVAIREMQNAAISEDELNQLKVKWRSDYFSTLEGGRGGMPRYGLMHLLACFTLFDNEPQLVNSILDGFEAVKPAEIQSVAQKYLRPENRAIVFRKPAAAKRRPRNGQHDDHRATSHSRPRAFRRARGHLAESHQIAPRQRPGSRPRRIARHPEIPRPTLVSFRQRRRHQPRASASPK